jgi:hypothetical protein
MIRSGGTAVEQSAISLTNRIRIVSRLARRCWTGIVAIATLLICHPLLAEQPSALACISNLPVPVYDGLLWQAQLTGTVVVRVVAGSDGAASEVQMVQSPHEFFKIWLPTWLKESRFLTECVGQTLELTFKYRLEGLRREAPDNHVVIKSPGIFEITASPPILHQTID